MLDKLPTTPGTPKTVAIDDDFDPDEIERDRTVRAAVEAIDRYLERGGEGMSEVRSGIARFSGAPSSGLAPRQAPACHLLEEALASIHDACPVGSALERARSSLHWITYDEYPEGEIGPRFPDAHAFASLIGPQGLLKAQDFEIGLFLIAPHTLYRDHHHAAPELYVPLTGPHRWRFGTRSPWEERPAHRPVWNDPWAVHATITGTRPFLSIFSWTRDVELPAKIVFADDWQDIEERLERRTL